MRRCCSSAASASSSSVTGYTMAAYHRNWPLSVEAGMKYFLVGALANALLVIGVTLLVGLLSHTGYTEMAPLIAARGSPLLLLGLTFTVIGIAFKLARSEEHTSELQSLMRISYAVFCLKKKKKANHN